MTEGLRGAVQTSAERKRTINYETAGTRIELKMWYCRLVTDHDVQHPEPGEMPSAEAFSKEIILRFSA